MLCISNDRSFWRMTVQLSLKTVRYRSWPYTLEALMTVTSGSNYCTLSRDIRLFRPSTLAQPVGFWLRTVHFGSRPFISAQNRPLLTWLCKNISHKMFHNCLYPCIFTCNILLTPTVKNWTVCLTKIWDKLGIIFIYESIMTNIE